MIGKHYRICEAVHHKHHRHYTVANCLNPIIYQDYIKAMKEDNYVIDVAKLRGSNYQNTFTITAKNYKVPDGLSRRLNEGHLEAIYKI